MGDSTKIEWTDATWNPVRGCSRVSEGCRHCYAETVAARFSGPGQPYEGIADAGRAGSKWTGQVRLFENVLTQPLRWKRPRRIFVNSMSDLFHENLSDHDILRVLDVIRRTSIDGGSNCGKLAGEHTHQVLTKRSERMKSLMTRLRFNPEASESKGELGLYLADDGKHPVVLKNLWLGVSVEDQKAADLRIPLLLGTPAARRFLSCEPLLEPVDLTNLAVGGDLRWNSLGGGRRQNGIDWVICGGESGPGARPMHPDWARSLRDQCASSGVPFFFKQWGEWTPGENVDRQAGVVETATWFDQRWSFGKESLARTDGHRDDEPDLYRIGKKAAGALLDGREHREFPDQEMRS